MSGTDSDREPEAPESANFQPSQASPASSEAPSVEATPPPSAEQMVEVRRDTSQDHRGGARTGKSSKKRPCFHCGAMTGVDVLAVTGDLCWNCYSPAGRGIMRWLILVTLVVGGVLGGTMWWRNRDASDRTVSTEESGEPDAKEGTANRPPDTRRRGEITSEQKVRFVKLHLLQGVPLATLVEQAKRDLDLQITEDDLQLWRKQFIEAGERGIVTKLSTDVDALGRRFNVIDQKLQSLVKLVGELRQNVDQLRRESAKYEGTADQRYILDPAAPPPVEK